MRNMKYLFFVKCGNLWKYLDVKDRHKKVTISTMLDYSFQFKMSHRTPVCASKRQSAH